MIHRSRLGFALLASMIIVVPVWGDSSASYAVPEDGWLTEDVLEYPADGVGLGGLAVAPDGALLLYANGVLEALEPDGQRVELATFDPPVYGSFVVVSPDGSTIYFAESTEYDIFRIPLEGGEPDRVDHQQFAFDLVFDREGRGFITALTNNPENEIVLFDEDPDSPNPTIIANVPGVSGPVAFDEAGNLYYGTVDFSGDPIRQSFHVFRRQLIDEALEGPPLDFSEGEVLIEGMDGFYDMVWADGRIFFSELGFAVGTGTVQVIDPERNYLVSTIASFPNDTGHISPSHLTFRPGTRSFVPGSGPRGGSLYVGYSNYSTVLRVAKITPELHFIRGEVNGDGVVDLSDAISILGYLFLGETLEEDLDAADVNADDELDLSDAVYALDFLFRGGSAIPAPYPDRGPRP